MNANNLHIYVMTHSIMAEVEAAKAENAQRESEGKAQAYGSEHFNHLAYRLSSLTKDIDFCGE